MPSLFVRLSLALLGPLLLAMLAAWAIGVGIVTRALEQRVEGQSRNAAAVLATWGLPYTPELLHRLAALQQADFALLDHGGRVVVSTSDTIATTLQAPLTDFLAAPQADRGTFRLESPVRSIAVYQPIAAANDPRYSALVAVAPLARCRGRCTTGCRLARPRHARRRRPAGRVAAGDRSQHDAPVVAAVRPSPIALPSGSASNRSTCNVPTRSARLAEALNSMMAAPAGLRITTVRRAAACRHWGISPRGSRTRSAIR